MSRKLFQLKSFFNYWLDAVDEHSLHSPFLFQFYTRVVKQKGTADEWQHLRQTLRSDNRVINVTDLGAGSAHMNKGDRTVSDIFRFTASLHKFSSLYARIIHYFHFRNVIELGTSVGINAIYLAKASNEVKLATFEGSAEIAAIAKGLFADNAIENIALIEGNIDTTLQLYLQKIDQLDFALIDANHRFEPTLRYLELMLAKVHAHSIIAIDDIHSSSEMELAWRSIQNHRLVYTTVDLYRCGLVFFNPSLTRQNVVLQF